MGGGSQLTDAQQDPCGGQLEEEAVTRTYTEEELSLLAEEGLPEMETIELEVTKDHQGLGITIAGYVCEKGKVYVVYVLPLKHTHTYTHVDIHTYIGRN